MVNVESPIQNTGLYVDQSKVSNNKVRVPEFNREDVYWQLPADGTLEARIHTTRMFAESDAITRRMSRGMDLKQATYFAITAIRNRAFDAAMADEGIFVELSRQAPRELQEATIRTLSDAALSQTYQNELVAA